VEYYLPYGKAEAASCRHVGVKSKTLAVGSQVDGDLVTICLNKTLQRKLIAISRPASKPVPKPVSKPRPKPVVKPLPKPIVRAPQKPVKTKPIVHAKTRINSNNSRAVFRPKAPTSSVSPASVLRVSQVASFTAIPKVIFGRAQLLGNPVLVRFTPNRLSWNFGDGVSEAGSPQGLRQTSHGFAAAGNYVTLLHTKFSVSYRLANGSWLADPDQITLASKPLNIQVGKKLPKPAAKTVLVTSG
jgi:hypothetical protein